ncbi:MAG: hypothetical protein HYR59_01745 [Acidobacteria bacterium]|nr:hypothetical protein [Acidobacteriota bacterium]
MLFEFLFRTGLLFLNAEFRLARRQVHAEKIDRPFIPRMLNDDATAPLVDSLVFVPPPESCFNPLEQEEAVGIGPVEDCCKLRLRGLPYKMGIVVAVRKSQLAEWSLHRLRIPQFLQIVSMFFPQTEKEDVLGAVLRQSVGVASQLG